MKEPLASIKLKETTLAFKENRLINLRARAEFLKQALIEVELNIITTEQEIAKLKSIN